MAGAFYPVRWFWAVIALVVGLASAVAKPSFDALVQRHVRESNQGRAFARFETRFQLMWVVGSFVPVVLSLPVAAGSLVMAVVAAVGSALLHELSAGGPGEPEGAPGHLTGERLPSGRAPRSRLRSAQPLLQPVHLGGQLGGQLVAEDGVVLADARHLGPPLVDVDP